MSTRYATPGGVTVHQVTLSGTPKPSRPGDPANHMDARDYLVRTLPGGRDRWYCPTLDDLKDLADREAWDVADLAPMPTYAVASTDGRMWHTDAGGDPFDVLSAAKFAAEANDAAGDRSHRVYVLADITNDLLEGAN